MTDPRAAEICLLIEAQLLVRGRSRIYLDEAHRRVRDWLASVAAQAMGTPGAGEAFRLLGRAESQLARAQAQAIPANNLYRARRSVLRAVDRLERQAHAPGGEEKPSWATSSNGR